MLPRPRHCPTCRQPLAARELDCPACATVVRGRWASSPLDRLSADQETFLLLFVRARGNLSDVERTLGVSYPTVRAKLDELIATLGEAVAPAPEPAAGRHAILEQVKQGRLSPDEALARLRQAPRKEETP